MTPVHVGARWSLIIAIAYVIQIGLVTQMRVMGVVPDIMVVLAVCAGLTGGAQRGAVAGFWIGLIFDLPRPHLLGLSAMAYSLVAFVAGTAQVIVLQSGRLISMLIVAAGSFLGVLIFAMEGQFFGEESLVNPNLASILVSSLVVGALTSRIGLRVAGWADGPETRSAAL